MRIIRCSNCDAPLPGQALYCAICGESLASPTEAFAEDNATKKGNQKVSSDRPVALKVPRFFSVTRKEQAPLSLVQPEDLPTQPGVDWQRGRERMSKRSRHSVAGWGGSRPTASPSPTPTTPHTNLVLTFETRDGQQAEDDPLDETIGDAWHSRTNWHKLVTAKNPAMGIQAKRKTSPELIDPTPVNPFSSVTPTRRRVPPTAMFWVSLLLLVSLFVGGLFGIAVTLGHGVFTPPPPPHSPASLQVSPASVALSATITLHGTNFTPNGRIGLSYDTTIPIIDTSGQNIITADKNGSFTDSAIVEPEWLVGSHTIHAEDATLHKIASFNITVTGHSVSLRPAHLQLSTDTVNLGSGDQATNSTQMVTLTNVGGGQIAWQAAASQPWLLLSPTAGTFSSGQNVGVVVAADRSNLNVGSYSASVIFSSNAGQITLPVKMQVTPLQPGHGAVLQLTPAVLSFTVTDGDPNPPAQVVTVSNPGLQPLQWSATSSSGNEPAWLAIAPQSGTIVQEASQSVTIAVNTASLLPGMYSSLVTFTSQGTGTVKGSPQSVYVSLTVVPQCMLQVSPGSLSFNGVYLQPAPAAELLSLGATEGCSAPLSWSATTTTDNSGKWLNIARTSGVTPALPAVSVNVTGLTPAIYTGAVTLSSAEGTQTVPVTLNIGQATTPIMTTTPPTLAFAGVIGQPDPAAQTITITNTGGGTMTWTATAATTVGGAWLAATPATGTLHSQESVRVQVTATLLSSLIPDTYNGTITITGTDGAGNPVLGSPQQIPVNFRVQAACAISVTPTTLNFAGILGQSNPTAQRVTIKATGACTHALNWTATVDSASTWLTATPTTGRVNLIHSSATNLDVVLTGLSANTYTGTVSITAIDSVTKQTIGSPQTITVTLMLQPPCTLQTPSPTSLSFSSEAGSNPATQSFTVAITGACGDNVTLTPTVTVSSGSNWLAVTPTVTTSSGGSTTFTVTVTSTALSAGNYPGTISLAAVDGGMTIVGSPQTVNISLAVLNPPMLDVSPTSLTFPVTTGVTTQAFTISNTGGEPLNWTATLASDAPSFVTLSASSGSNLVGGANLDVNVNVDATRVAGNTTYNTTVTVSATDPLTGNVVPGSPITVAITITVASPSMQLSSSNLSFNATTGGTTPTPQSITISNTGGGTFTWTVDTSSTASWLTVSAINGSTTAETSSTLTLTADPTGLTAGTYTTTFTITPSTNAGTPVTVMVTFTVTAATASTTGTPTPTVPPTPSPSATA